MHQFEESRVGAEEIDSLGHLNVRFYLARVDRASRGLFGALGVTDGWLDRHSATLRRVDTYSRFRREQFEGSVLTVHGGVLRAEDTRLRCYFEIRNPAKDQIAATFVTGTELADRATRQPLELPASAREINEQYGVQIPAHGAPRTLSLDTPRTDVRLDELLGKIGEASEFGMTGRREGTIEAEDCGPDGLLRDDVDLMFVMIRRLIDPTSAKSFGPPVLYTDEGHRFGWAMLETRNIEFARPRAGDEVIWLGADVGITDKSRQSRRWAFVKSSGQLLSINDSVGIAMDLDARKAIQIPASIRKAMDGYFLPEYA